MAYLDHKAARDLKEQKEAYAELLNALYLTHSDRPVENKEQLLSNLKDKAKSIHKYLSSQEKKMYAIEKELDEYRKLFRQFSKLLPQRRSIHDTIY